MNTVENWLFAAVLVPVLGLLLVTALRFIKASVVNEKVNTAALLRDYAEMLVMFAEQTGKIKGMSGAEKKMMVMSLLDQEFPNAPAWVKDAAVEAAVLLLEETAEKLAKEYQKLTGE